ncbi:MAG TPA: uroporphyrinogen-III synthase [Gaiellaceae bacterium]
MRVVVTRRREQAGGLVERLEAIGHEVVVCPLIEIVPLGEGPVDVRGYDWLVVTSANGAAELRRRGTTGPLPRVAAIGPATAATLEAGGVRVELVPAAATQDGILAELPRPAGRVLLAAAEGARRLLVDELGAELLPLYRTREVRPAKRPSGDLVVLASGSQARALAGLGLELPVVSIGPQTTAVARELGLRVVAEADSHDLDGLIAAVERAG